MFTRTRAAIANAIAPSAMKSGHRNNDLLASVFALGGGTTGAVRGTKQLLDAYSTQPWLRAVVNKISHSISMTTWTLQVARRLGDGGGELRYSRLQGGSSWESRHASYSQLRKSNDITLEEIESHPLLDLLQSGNPNLPGQTVLQVTQEHLDMVGEAFWLKERDNTGQVIHVFPVPPPWVRDMPTKDKPTFTIDFHGNTLDVPPEDVVVFKEPNPADPYGRGSGLAKTLGDELETDEHAARYARQTFQNRARPDFIVSPEGGQKLQLDQVERLRESWMDKTRGFLRAGTPLFLPQALKFTPISQSFEELELIKLRLHGRDIVLQVFGMPPEKMGINVNSNRANIEGADLIYAKEILLPRQNRIRAVLQQQLVPDFNDNLILDFVSPVMEDRDHALAVRKATPWAYSANEHRAAAGEESLGDDGDKFFVPLNGTFVEQFGDE